MLSQEFKMLLGCLSGYGRGYGSHVEHVRSADETRTLFYYYRDRYALQLLGFALANHHGLALSELKSSRYGRLLEKRRVKALLAQSGKGRITEETLALFDSDADTQCYALTIGRWGSRRWRDKSWQQTSRRGINLVLQVNFTGRHEQLLNRHMRPDKGFDLFDYHCHPVSRCGRRTLGWARMDIDLDGGEVLIEEIQNDWLREAAYYRSLVDHPRWDDKRWRDRGIKGGGQGLMNYFDQALKPILSVWDETILSAALWFIRCELGLRKIFYHTPESGTLLKNMRHSAPPVSVYSDLPRRFCFEETRELPVILKEDQRASHQWQRSPKTRMYALPL